MECQLLLGWRDEYGRGDSIDIAGTSEAIASDDADCRCLHHRCNDHSATALDAGLVGDSRHYLVGSHPHVVDVYRAAGQFLRVSFSSTHDHPVPVGAEHRGQPSDPSSWE